MTDMQKSENWRHRVEFLQRVSVHGMGGRRLDKYSLLAVVWAGVKFEKMDAARQEGKRVYRSQVTLTTHFMDRLMGAERVKIDGKFYEIESLTDKTGLRQFLECEASSVSLP